MHWDEFLTATNNIRPNNYDYIFPQDVIEHLADNVFQACKDLDLQSYADQIQKHGTPISKILNDAWQTVLSDPAAFSAWESQMVTSIATT
jgi:hypothetical protein